MLILLLLILEIMFVYPLDELKGTLICFIFVSYNLCSGFNILIFIAVAPVGSLLSEISWGFMGGDNRVGVLGVLDFFIVVIF